MTFILRTFEHDFLKKKKKKKKKREGSNEKFLDLMK